MRIVMLEIIQKLIDNQKFWNWLIIISILGIVMLGRPVILDKLLNSIDGITKLSEVFMGFLLGKYTAK